VHSIYQLKRHELGLALILGILTGVCLVELSPGLDFLFLLSILLLTGLILTPVIKNVLNRKFDPCEAKIVFSIFFGFFTLSPLISVYLHGIGVEFSRKPLILQFFSREIDSTTIYASILCSLSLLFFYVGYHSRLPKLLCKHIPLPSIELSTKRIKWGIVFLFAVSIILFVELMGSVGGLKSYLLAGYSSHLLVIGKSHLLISYSWLAIVILLYYFLGDVSNNKKRKFVALTLLGIYVIFNGLVGRRRIPGMLLLALVIYKHYSEKKLTLKKLGIIIGLFLFYLFFFAALRGYNPLDYYQGVQDLLADFTPSMLLHPLTGGEQAPFEAFLTMVEKVPSQIDYKFGATYLNLFLVWIPRGLWAGRPDTVHWYLETLFPETRETMTGYGFFLLAEPYLNFGFIGPLLFMFILGVLYKSAYTVIRTQAQNKKVILLYSIIIAYTPSLMRSESLAIKEFLLEFFLPALIVLAYGSRWKFLKRSSNNWKR